MPFGVPTPLRDQDRTSTSARCRGLAVHAAGLSSWRLFCMIASRHSERPHLLAPQRYSRVELGNRSAGTKAYARGDEPMPQAIAVRIVEKGGDHVLALKGNQSSLHEDVRLFFDCPVLAGTCATQPANIDAPVMAVSKSACAGSRTPVGSPSVIPSGRACARSKRSPKGVSTRNPARRASRRGSSLPRSSRDPNVILHAGRSHWGIKNNLHLTLDVIFYGDCCRTRKDNAPLSLAITRHTPSTSQSRPLKWLPAPKTIRAWCRLT